MHRRSSFGTTLVLAAGAALSFVELSHTTTPNSSSKKPELLHSSASEAPVTSVSLQDYLSQELPKIIAAQEKRLGITYATKPSIPLQLDDLHDERVKNFLRSGTSAYVFKCNEIHLSPLLFKRPTDCTGDCCFFDLAHACIIPKLRSALKSALDHELGHFYTDTLGERLNAKDWPPFSHAQDLNEIDLMYFTLCEGIADYFMHTMNTAEEDTFNEDHWPKNSTEATVAYVFEPRLFYKGGYHFVRPIIDVHGACGIEHLVRYVPQKADLFTLPELQKRMLEELAQKSK